MRGYNYHFTMNPVNQTIKLRPTKGTYAKALAPSVILFVGFGLMGAIAQVAEKRETNRREKSTNTDD